MGVETQKKDAALDTPTLRPQGRGVGDGQYSRNYDMFDKTEESLTQASTHRVTRV